MIHDIFGAYGMSPTDFEPRSPADAIASLCKFRKLVPERHFDRIIEEAAKFEARGAAYVAARNELYAPIRKLTAMARNTDNQLDAISSCAMELPGWRLSGISGLGNMGAAPIRFPELWAFDAQADDRLLAFGDASPRDVESVACCVMYPSADPYGDRFQIEAISECNRKAAPKELQWAERVFALHAAWPGRDGLRLCTVFIGWHRGRFFHGLNRAANGSYYESRARLLLGRKFVQHYDWRAEFHVGGILGGFTMPTTPHGALSLFRSRARYGNRRMPALLHWVRAHRRRRMADGNVIANVRAHLRGVREFDWNGIRVVLHAAKADTDALGKGST